MSGKPYIARRIAAKASGEIHNLPDELRHAFQPSGDFEALPEPGPRDWLAVHPEDGQNFAQFAARDANVPDPQRRTIVLQPLGSFPDNAPKLDLLMEFSRAFFPLQITALPPVRPGGTAFTARADPRTGRRQVLATDILDLLARSRPEDAYCMLALTMEDLYPEPGWNFVFGLASLTRRVGVFSLARYDPAFFGESPGPKASHRLLERACRVLAHETCHMMGMGHCVYYRCLMNGSNHLAESDARPLHLCPVCLRKLHYVAPFDPLSRYRALTAFFRDAELGREEEWCSRRLLSLRAAL